MTVRTLVAGIVAGVVVFIWGAVSHMALPLGEVGIKQIPNEAPVLAAMRASISEPGFYFFPGMDMSATPSEAQQKEWEEKYRAGPYGVLVYHPQGTQPMSPRQLLTELAANIASALLAALLLSATALEGFGRRVLFVTGLGLFATVTVLVSYWNWYGFPSNFVLASMADETIGWFLGGLVLAAMIKRK